MHGFKYHGRRECLGWLGRRVAATPRAAPLLMRARALLVPVPLARSALRRRGYNQASDLARGVADQSGLPLDARALRRRRETVRQASSRTARRRVQLRGALAARPGRVAGRDVVLVDDVISTGATADAAARACRIAGARTVGVLTLAT